MSSDNYHTAPQIPGVQSSAELERNAANFAKQQQDALVNSFKIDTSKTKDGKARLFGFEIPAELAPTINIVLAGVMLPLSKSVSEFVYKQTKAISETELAARNLPALHKNGAKIALAAELATMWGTLAARPISEFVSANQHYTTERWKLGREIKSICEATGAAYNKNEVLASAFHRVHQNWVDEIKLVIPSLLSSGVYTMYGLKMHNETVQKRQGAIDVSEKMAKTSTTSKPQTEAEVRQALAIEKNKAIDELKHEELVKFRKKYGSKYSEKELKEQFSDYWTNIRKDMDGKDESHNATSKGGFFGDNTQDVMNFGLVATAAQTLGEAFSGSMRKAAAEHSKHLTSYELILQLKEQMQGRQDTGSVQSAVVNIFQQLEEDMGRTKFAGGLLEKLTESVQPIADAIAKGNMDPLTLVKLAGEHKIIAHSATGKRSFRNDDEIKKAIDEARSLQVIKDNEISEEAFIAKFANPVLAKDTIRKNLAEMKDPAVRDFFISLMPAEILEHTGLGKDAIRDARRRSHDALYDRVGAAIIHIAAGEQDTLKKHGLSTREIEEIKSLSERIMAGDKEALQTAVDNKDASITSVVATEMLASQMDGKAKVWAERVAEGKSLDAHIQTIIAQKETKTKESKEGEEKSPMPAKDEQELSHVERRAKKLEAGERNMDLGA